MLRLAVVVGLAAGLALGACGQSASPKDASAPATTPTTSAVQAAMKAWVERTNIMGGIQNTNNDIQNLVGALQDQDQSDEQQSCTSLQYDIAYVSKALPSPDTTLNLDYHRMLGDLSAVVQACQHGQRGQIAADIDAAASAGNAVTARLSALAPDP